MKSVNVLLVKRMLLRDRNQKDVFFRIVFISPRRNTSGFVALTTILGPYLWRCTG